MKSINRENAAKQINEIEKVKVYIGLFVGSMRYYQIHFDPLLSSPRLSSCHVNDNTSTPRYIDKASLKQIRPNMLEFQAVVCLHDCANICNCYLPINSIIVYVRS